MKIFKKVLVILLIVALYFNIGYYYGKSMGDARIKYKNESLNSLNSFQKFQLGGWKLFRSGNENFNYPAEVQREMETAKILCSPLWPLLIFLTSLIWIVYGIAQAAVGIWSAIVFLWNFFFCGGFFKLLGNLGYRWILMIIVFLLFVFKSRRIYKRMKRL